MFRCIADTALLSKYFTKSSLPSFPAIAVAARVKRQASRVSSPLAVSSSPSAPFCTLFRLHSGLTVLKFPPASAVCKARQARPACKVRLERPASPVTRVSPAPEARTVLAVLLATPVRPAWTPRTGVTVTPAAKAALVRVALVAPKALSAFAARKDREARRVTLDRLVLRASKA